MLGKIQALTEEINAATAQSAEAAEALRIKYLSKKGSVTALFDDFKNVPNEQKREIGKLLNDLKTLAQDKINSLKESFSSADNGATGDDLSLQATSQAWGGRHPLSIVRNDIIEIFSRLGF